MTAAFSAPATSTPTRFSRFSWGVLGYALLVILWGVYLRASGSGDGCGVDWPSCIGSYTIRAGAQTKTFIEYAHRASIGVLILLQLGQIIWGLRSFPRKHPVRFALGASLVFNLLEGWIGRQLVVHKLVAGSTDPDRVYWFVGHQVNTLLLLGSFALIAWWSSGQPLPQFKKQGPFAFMAAFAIALFLGLTVTGAMSALGDTVDPPRNYLNSHEHVMRQALLPTANAVMKSRPAHPYTAVVVAMFLCLVAGLFDHLRPSPMTRRFSYSVWLVLGLQMMI
ncbi:protoheme IX farnesyltransferase, partial [bacterium]